MHPAPACKKSAGRTSDVATMQRQQQLQCHDRLYQRAKMGPVTQDVQLLAMPAVMLRGQPLDPCQAGDGSSIGPLLFQSKWGVTGTRRAAHAPAKPTCRRDGRSVQMAAAPASWQCMYADLSFKSDPYKTTATPRSRRAVTQFLYEDRCEPCTIRGSSTTVTLADADEAQQPSTRQRQGQE